MRRGLPCLIAVVVALVCTARQAQSQGRPGGGQIQPLCVEGCGGGAGVQVVPEGASINVPPNSGPHTATFLVTNTGSSSATFTLSCTAKKVTCGSVSPTSLTLGSGISGDADVSFTVGNLAGTVTLTATGPATGSGTATVSLVYPAAPVVALRNQNGDNLERGLCLTSGAGEAAAVQCGDLLVAHSTPTYATMGKDRAITLVYNSAQAVPRPTIAVSVTQLSGVAQPTAVVADLRVGPEGGTLPLRATATYTAWDFSSAPTRQIVLAYTDTTTATGIYRFELTVTNQYGTGNLGTTVTGYLILVNRAASSFGRGWAVAGVEELRFLQPAGSTTGDILWLGADGSAKRYRKLSATTWVAPAGAFRDTLVYSSAAGTYTRTLRHGIQVVFDGQGRHTSTVSRTQQHTDFTYLNGRLSSIVVPPVGGSNRTHTFAYDAAGALDRITDPAGRVLDATVTGGRLTALVDPDTTLATTFGYDPAGRMTSRTNRRGFTATYNYAQGLRVSSIVIPGALPAGDTTRFLPWDEQGLAAASTGQTAADTAMAYTRVFGPRIGINDNASFWVDRWGAPTRIVNPLGQVTALVRGDTANPALVTRATYPDLSITLLSYDARGNLRFKRDSTLHLPNGAATAVTQWVYDSGYAKDSPSRVTDPTNVVTRYGYNQWGLMHLVIAPNGHRTTFDYIPVGDPSGLGGLLRAVVDSAVLAWNTDSAREVLRHPRVAFAYNGLGNLVGDTSAMGRVRRYLRDSRQLVTDVYDGAGYRAEYTYNQANVLLNVGVHVEQPGTDPALYPADSGATAALWTRRYARVGLLDSLVDPRGVTRRFTYNGAGQVATEASGPVPKRIWYNAAGQVDSLQYRTGGKVRYSYDAGGRLLTVRWEARDDQPADSVTYTYDAGNRILTAATGAGFTTTRTYYANGALKSEEQRGPGVLFRHAYSYDAAGRRLTYVIGPPGNPAANDSITYRYQAATGQLHRIHVRWRRPSLVAGDPIASDSVWLGWDALERRDSVAFTNGAVIRYAYDLDGSLRVLCSEHALPAGSSALRYSLHNTFIDAAGRTRRVSRTGHTLCPTTGLGVLGGEAAYRYDVRGQVLRDSTDPGAWWELRYDASGNMIQRVRRDRVDSNAYSIQAGTNLLVAHYRNGAIDAWIGNNDDGARSAECPQLTGGGSGGWILPQCVVGPGYREYHYDGLGRTAGTHEYTCTDVGDYGWDCGFFDQSSGSNRYCTYDPLGRLARGCADAFQLGYDGQNVSRTVTDSLNGWTFVQGPGVDDPLLGYSIAAGGTHAYFIGDGGGRLYTLGGRDGDTLTTGSGAKALAFQNYGGAYSGGTTKSAGFNAERFSTPEQPGLSFFRNRVYDQATGRWTQEDPIGIAGGMNLYQFNGNNPAMYADPFGLCPESLRAKKEECEQYNREKLADAMALVEAEKAAGNPHALDITMGPLVYNGDEVRGKCEEMGSKWTTDHGCSNGYNVVVSADDPIPTVAAILMHEQQHDIGKRSAGAESVPAGEQCARKRATNFIEAMQDQSLAMIAKATPGIVWTPNFPGCDF